MYQQYALASMKVAVQGCCHGDLDTIYDHIQELESKNGYNVDVLLICGDLQAIRNHQDLQCIAVPNKYKEMKDFHKYYTGERVAPILTIVIGGNHEASNYLWELYHGGWVAPNIYYLGHAGCIQVNGVRIAGASGIYKPRDFHLGNHERLPYDQNTIRSAYHIREFTVRKLSLLSSPRIFLSHDWPQSIEHYGNIKELLRRKSFLRQDIDAEKLGSPPLMSLLKTLTPEWWFAAHLHTYYEAIVNHATPKTAPPPTFPNPDEIGIDELENEPNIRPTLHKTDAESNGPITDGDRQGLRSLSPPKYMSTKFLALDKCLPKRKFLEVIDLPILNAQVEKRHSPKLTFDPEWLAITRAFQPWLSTVQSQRPFPSEDDARKMVCKELKWVKKKLGDEYEIAACQTFTISAPEPDNIPPGARIAQPPYYPNIQTAAFCALLEMENKVYPHK
ncbi:hypothetical protein AX15_004718 [Amanita polypyramis BW_CC]|nr:hypothetical protein AX15_004718 [Amanita polypyramis BW_CC]